MYIRKNKYVVVILLIIALIYLLSKSCTAYDVVEIEINTNTTMSDSYDDDIIFRILVNKIVFVITGFSLIILMKITKNRNSKKLKIAIIILEIIAIFIEIMEIFIPVFVPAWSGYSLVGECDCVKYLIYVIVIFMMLEVIKNEIYTKQNSEEKDILYFSLLSLIIASIIIIIYYRNFDTYIEIISSIGYAINVIRGITIAIKSKEYDLKYGE